MCVVGLFSWIILLSLVHTARGVKERCPVPCSCSYKGEAAKVLDCSNLNWERLPLNFIFPPSVVNISLAYNKFKVLLNGTFTNLTNLQSLNISHNRLSRMDYSCFEGLESLTTLDISYNELKMTTNVYTPGIFRHLKNLTFLDIHANIRQSTTDQKYPDEALSELEFLQELMMDGLTDVTFGQGFRKLTHLTVLDMSVRDDESSCVLINVHNTTFSSLSYSTLSLLKLVQCDIYRIAPGAFSMLTFLTELDLSKNDRLTFKGMTNASVGFNLTNIQVVHLNGINRHSDPWTLKQDDFVHFHDTNLKTLTLDSNRITNIEVDVIDVLPITLQLLTIRENYLTDAHFLAELVRLENLLVFDISYQLHYTMSLGIIPKNEITSLAASQESPEDPEAVEGDRGNTQTFETKPIEMKNTMNYSIMHHDKRTENDVIKLPFRLRKAIGNNLKIDPLSAPPVTFDANNSLEYLDLSSNGVHAWYGKWSGLHFLRFLNVSFNGIFRVAPDTFGDMASLNTLFLNGNRLGVSIMQDKQFLTFSNQTKLIYLNLSDNAFTDLPEFIFVKQTNLKILDLRYNYLTAINFRMKSLGRIKEINLSNNTIRELTRINMEEIDYLSKKSNFTIDLTGNPLLCTCDQLEQLRWMAVSKPVFRNLKQYTCKANNGSFARLQWLDDLVGGMEIDCIAEEVILICAVVFCGLCFILALAALAYYKKSRLMYHFSVGRKHCNPLGTKTPKGTNIQVGEENEEQLKYTVYLSMASSEEGNKFAEQLEEYLTDKGISVCIPELSGQSGMNETIAIVQTMNKCACILALIDNEYMVSFPRLFEFEVAVTEGIQNRFSNLIVVLLKDLDNKHLQMNDFVAMFCRENYFFDGRKSQGRLFSELENEIIRYKEFVDRRKQLP
ncbi:toll-like receptor 4 isoform X2 [Argopecten irradians]